MKRLIKIDEGGAIEAYCEVPDDLVQPHLDIGYTEVAVRPPERAEFLINGKFIVRPKETPAYFVYNKQSGEWYDPRPIQEVRDALIASLQIERDTRIEGGFVWDGSTFQSDTAVSQPRLLGLFTTAVAGGIPPEGYPWRLADNSWRVLSAADAIAVWGAFQAHMAGLFAAFAAHEAAVLAEDDIEVLRSYDTKAGWPV